MRLRFESLTDSESRIGFWFLVSNGATISWWEVDELERMFAWLKQQCENK